MNIEFIHILRTLEGKKNFNTLTASKQIHNTSMIIPKVMEEEGNNFLTLISNIITNI